MCLEVPRGNDSETQVCKGIIYYLDRIDTSTERNRDHFATSAKTRI